MMVKRPTTSILVMLAMLLTMIFPGAVFAETTRMGGEDRFLTALDVAKQGWPTGAENIVLINGYAPSDAAVAGPLAYKLNAPVLLTDTSRLPETTLKEIQTLGAKNITLIGGTGVISDQIETQLKVAKYNVVRYGGKDRYDTAAQISSALDKPSKAVVVSGESTMDALAAASWAAVNKAAILYTEKDVLPSVTQEALTKAGVTSSVVIGGEGVVSPTVFKALPLAQRYGGADRYATATSLAAGLQPQAEKVFVTTGSDFVDAMVGVGLAAKTNSPLIYVDQAIPTSVENYFKSANGKVKSLSVIGGAGIVTEAQKSVLLKLAGLASDDPYQVFFDAATTYFNAPSGWITPDDLQKKLTSEPEKHLVLDVRQPDAYAKGHIKGAINIPFNTSFGASLPSLRARAQGKTVTVACYTGQTAAQVTSLLNIAGIKAQSLSFGMGKDGFDQGWLKTSNPVTTDPTPALELPTVTSPNPVIDQAINNYFTQLVANNQIKASELKAALEQNPSQYLVIDIRQAVDFDAKHIKGSINVPWGPELAKNLASLQKMSLGKTVVVVCYTGQSAGKTTSLLNLVGMKAKALAFGFGRPEYKEGWTGYGYETVDSIYDAVQNYYLNLSSDSYKIPLATLKAALDAKSDEYVILDLRGEADYAKGHIPGAINVPFGPKIAENLDNIRALAQGKTLVVACYTGQTAAQTDSLLNLAGIKTRSLDFGMGTDAIKKGWNYQEGYPVVVEPTSMPAYFAPVPSPNLWIDAAVKKYFAEMPKDIHKIGLPEMKAALEANPANYLLVDIRRPDVYAKSHIKGAINVPFGADIAKSIDKIKSLSQGKTVVVYCYTGQTAGQTDSLLNVVGIPTLSLNFGYGTTGFTQGWSTMGYDSLTE